MLSARTGTDSITAYDVSSKFPYGRPHPSAQKAIRDFDQMIGSCHCKSVARNPDQTWTDMTTMIWVLKYILNGNAVQDEVWRPDGRYAGSIRQYHPDSAKWVVSYYSQPGVSWTLGTWHGMREKDQIVLYKDQKASNRMDGFYRITFYDISEAGFNWKGEWVDLTENFSFPTWLIYCNKRG